MRTLFELGKLSNTNTGPLLMELGPDYCLLSQLDAATDTPQFAGLYTFEQKTLPESLEEIRNGFIEAGATPPEPTVAIAFPEITALPPNGRQPDLLGALFPGHGGTVHHHNSGSLQYQFAVPAAVAEALGSWRVFRYVPVLACMPQPREEGSTIDAFFVDSHFRVAVYSNGMFQLRQQYRFTTPLDVVYYLLKICTEFGLSQQDTLLSVSGFITRESALYKELHQYFLDISFAYPETLEIDGNEVPKHYFSSLYNLAACAS